MVNLFRMGPRLRGFLTIVLFSLLFLSGADAQQFGKNKVQYRTYDWKYIQSDHFDIYFYDSAGLNLAKFSVNVLEDALNQIQDHWRYRITSRIAIVLFNSHNEFQQNNVVDEYLPEGVGGVTELFKNRVVVPFEGDWEKFRHVLHHELVHAVLNDKFYGGSIQSLVSNNVQFFLPIWMNEGLAEFESHNGYDIETDMFIRDAVIGGFLPSLDQLNGYFAYRGGQTFYWYVEQTYGRQKISELLNRAKSAGDLDAAFKSAFGKTVEEFSEQWLYDLKKIYWPDVADRKRPVDFSIRVTNHKKDDSYFNTSPSISPNGDRIAYISDRDGPRSVYVLKTDDPGDVKQIIEGENDVDFEELHLLTPAIAWSPDSRKVSFSVKSNGRDAIYVIDVESGDQEKFEFDLDAIYSVNWSPDGKRLAFQGIRGDQSDIYTYDMATRKLANVTDDVFSDYDPNWASDSRTIYFLSDRRDNPIGAFNHRNFEVWTYDYDTRDIFSIDVDANVLKRITFSENESESAPTPGPDGRLLYISDRNGINNIFLLDTNGTSRPLTNSISGIDQLSLSRDAGKLVYISWNDDGYDIFLTRMPFDVRLEGDTIAPTKYLQRMARAEAAPTDSAVVEQRVNVVTSIVGYEGVKVDPSESAESFPSEGTVAQLPPSSVKPPPDALADSGDYRVKDYKVKFSADLIQAAGNYNAFYGVQGMIQMLFSDVMGNHQIYIASDLQLDLKNSDFVVSYNYLPERIDYGLDVYQTSTFAYLPTSESNYNLMRFRQFGANGRASNPFDRFRRLELGISIANIWREAVDANAGVADQSKLMLVPSISYVFDNSTPGLFNPFGGARYNIEAKASPKLGNGGAGFYSFTGDFRKYFPLDKIGFYSLAFRGSGGASFGPNPQKFTMGGIDNWLNYEFSDDRVSLENAEDFFYFAPAYPMRGYNFSEAIGSKYFLGNVEFRFPLIRALITGPLPVLLQYISGSMFLDVGAAWDKDLNLTRTAIDGSTVTDDLLIGTGIGARTYVFGLPVRMDVAWSYDLEHWSRPKYYFSLGYDF